MQVNSLTAQFQAWFDSARTERERKRRARYWATFLVLRFTGARLGEVLAIQDDTDIDWRNAEVRIRTLKRRGEATRTVFLPANVVAELSQILVAHPDLRGRLFKLDPANFRKVFRARAEEAGIPRKLSHPHILRHTRAIELIRAGVPLTLVQNLLGHASLTTTAVYLQIHPVEAKHILRERGLI
ncbi:site-specific integrase [Thermosulfurimonas sp. F29]|uniref:tyrosine-type recombinase/integrase n=1 Tax=Thermosulfurimonas sp. F29 TaxID=2867247 RepID=UPI002102137C|nr:site-specific integrase [Thermosulfurimonas sp. F29]